MASSEAQAARPRRPWALTLFGLLAAGGLIAMPLVAGLPEDTAMPDLVHFLGRFHRVLLHLPIGVFILILLQELGAIFFRKGETTIFPIFFGAVSAILAVVAGFLLYHSGGYEDSALAERHLWGGLGFAVAAVLTFVVKAWTVALAANTAFYRLLLFGSVGVMGFASHDGASLTHGPDYLTAYAPEPVRRVLGMEPRKKAEPTKPIEDRLVYSEIVHPIFERHCVECHKEGKVKGRFRMDTYEFLVKGGKEGAGLEPGDAAGSNVVYRVELPIDDDERMPPDQKAGLSEQELLVVKWWIDKGADPEKSVGELEPDEEVLAALQQLAPTGAPVAATEEDVSDEPGADEGLKEAVAELSKEFPGALTFESQGSPYLTFTAVSLRGNLDDDMFNKLAPVIPHIVSADLNATQISDRSLALLSAAENLKLIRLAETQITDEGIEALLKIPSLESVNLYGTKVTDAGVLKLAQLPNLKRLYLWQTEVSEETIAALQEKLPDCEIIKGI
jgi:uncharacterized membrane protein